MEQIRTRDPFRTRRELEPEIDLGHQGPAELLGERGGRSLRTGANQQRQRRHHRPLRLEGENKSLLLFLGRSVQRRDGHT